MADPARYNFALMFKALGDPTRLRIFEFLQSCTSPVAVDETGDVRRVTAPLTIAPSMAAAAATIAPPRLTPDGLTVGEICCHVTGEDRISSAISFHLKELRLAGLIQMERRGKHMICSVNADAVDALADYFRRTANGGCC